MSVNENQISAITLVATDESTVTYSIQDTYKQFFNINSSTGVMTFKLAPNYESVKKVYWFDVYATDLSGNKATQTITINILDVDDLITYNGITYDIVTSPFTNKVWLDRNLGATINCPISDDENCYGNNYQWGRNADGHENASSNTTSTQATDISNVGHSDFIIDNDNYMGDWANNLDSDGSLRSTNWSKTDGSSICPIGYIVPSISELENETISASTPITNTTDAYTSFLKLPAVNSRKYIDGTVEIGSYGIWSTNTQGDNGIYL